MTARMVLGNIASFGLQVAVLVAAGAALARAFRIDEPRTMLAYWRTLLVACLLLPLCQPWTTVIPPALSTTTIVTAGSAAAAAGALAPVASRSMSWPIGDLVLIGLVAGIAARALWLTIGAYGLRRLRQDASPLDPLPESVRRAQERIGTQAGMYVSDRISGPITFGLLRPVVVFPPSVSAMPAHVQQAIAYHELLHVKRRDWLYEILEEAVRSVLWFHPAIWWLIGRIQLTREQVVDQAAIQLTESRERYVESLLAVALASSRAAFTPASPFLRRHLLKRRVARILQETTMTTRRLIASLAASAAALALAGTLAVRSFPLEAQGRAPADNGEPIQLVKGGEHLLHGERPEYPRRAVEQKIEGDVVVEMTLNDRGEVSDARVVSGPEELRKATLEAVLQWHYSPAAINSTVTQATLRFHLPPAGLEKAEFPKKVYVVEGMEGTLRSWAVDSPKHAEHRLMAIEQALEDPAMTDEQRAELKAKHAEVTELIEKIRADHHKEPLEVELEMKPESHELQHHELAHELSGSNVALKLGNNLALKLLESEKLLVEPKFEGTPRLVEVRTERVSEATAKELLARADVAVGDSITEETAERIRQAALAMDEHFRVEFQKGRDGGLIVTILAR